MVPFSTDFGEGIGWQKREIFLPTLDEEAAGGTLIHWNTMAREQENPLVPALAGGEPRAFAALFDRLSAPMLRMAVAMLRCRADSDDAVQDAFVRIVRNRHCLAEVLDLEAYAFAILRHIIYRRLKNKRNDRQDRQQFRPVPGEENAALLHDDLQSALQQLPPEQREAIVLKIDANLTFAQIGEILAISPHTAASRYRYGLEKLRRFLE
jgi:RNA polymerase sigma-70 factor (ECF subfamily)